MIVKMKKILAVMAMAVALMAMALPTANAARAVPANTPPVTSANLILTASNGDSVCCTTIQANWSYYSGATRMSYGTIANGTPKTECIVTNRMYFSGGGYVRLDGGVIQPGTNLNLPGYPPSGSWSPYDPLTWSVSLADCNRPGLGGSAGTTSGDGT